MAEKISAEEAKQLNEPSRPSEKKAGGLPPEEGFVVLGPIVRDLDFPSLGRPLKLGPMKVGQTREFLKEARTLIPLIQEMLKKDGVVDVGVLTVVDPDTFMTGMSIASGVPISQLDEMENDEFIQLIGAVFEVNVDFFLRILPKVVREVVELCDRAAERLRKDTTTPSSA